MYTHVSFEPQIISEPSKENCKENIEKLFDVGCKFNGTIFVRH
jgi:hypothetical protein